MLSIANNAVNIDYSNTSKSLDGLIKKYDSAIKSIKEQEKSINSLQKSMNNLSNGSGIDSLTKKLNETKQEANSLKSSIFGILSPFNNEITGTLGGFDTFTSGVNTIISSFVELTSGSTQAIINLQTLGAVLTEIAGAFVLVSLFASNMDANAAENVTAIFDGLSNVISSVIPLFETFKSSNISMGEAAGLLGIVLGELFAAFFAISLIVKWLGASGLSSVGKLFTGLGAAIAPLGGLFESFKNSELSVWTAGGLLLIVLGELLGFLLLLSIIIKIIDVAKILAISLALGSLALVLASVALLFSSFGESGMSVDDAMRLLLGTLAELILFLTALVVLAAQLSKDPYALVGLLALVAAISVVMLVLAETLPTILDACATFINAIAPVIITLLTTIGEIIVDIIYAMGTVLPPIIEKVGVIFGTIFKGIKGVIESVGTVLVNILNSVQSLITTVLSSLLSFINNLGPAIDNFVTHAINAVTKLINFIISGIEYIINTLFIGSINNLISKLSGITEFIGIELPRIPKVQLDRFVPKLAKGAVIPPRQEFLAILGDQKHGTNIEAPLETIKQANREVIKEFGGLNPNEREIILKNLTIVTQFGNKEFKKMVMDSIRLSEKEIGKPLLVS